MSATSTQSVGANYADIWRMNIAEVARLGKGHPGFCAGMTILWILLRKSNSDFGTRQEGGRTYATLTGEQVRLIQEFQQKRVDEGEDAYPTMLKGKVDGPFTAKAVNDAYDVNDLKQLAETVSSSTDKNRSTLIGMEPTCFYLVRFAQGAPGSGQSGHVAAIEVKGLAGQKQKIRYTDIMGVSGCIEFNSKDEFAAWLSDPTFAFGGHTQVYKYSIRVQQVIYADPLDHIAVKMFAMIKSATG